MWEKSRGAGKIRLSAVAKNHPQRSRGDVISLRSAKKRGTRSGEKLRRRTTCRSSGRTFDNELYFPRRCVRSTWESRSVPEIDREVAGLARVFPRRFPSTFVVSAAFIDGKTVVPSRATTVRFPLRSWRKSVTLPTSRGPSTFRASREQIC